MDHPYFTSTVIGTRFLAPTEADKLMNKDEFIAAYMELYGGIEVEMQTNLGSLTAPEGYALCAVENTGRRIDKRQPYLTVSVSMVNPNQTFQPQDDHVRFFLIPIFTEGEETLEHIGRRFEYFTLYGLIDHRIRVLEEV